MPDIPAVTGEKIKELRKRMHLTQAELGQVLRVDAVYVSNLETGKKELADTPLRVLILWLMSVFGVAGGQAPHSSIPVVIAPQLPAVPRTKGRGPYRVAEEPQD